MVVICYICNKRSSEWSQNFAEIKSRHTLTPIIDFIRQFLGDFHSARNIDDESNRICAECLQQINDYDWMRQQVSKQETKLRDLLLTTETNVCVKSNEPVGIEENEANYSYIDDDELDSEIDDNEILVSTTTISTHPKDITSPVVQYPKPIVPYRCLIGMALRNSHAGSLPVNEIYSFISKNFPHFKMTTDKWKNSVRHTLSISTFFEKNPGKDIRSCLWSVKPSKAARLEIEIRKFLQINSTTNAIEATANERDKMRLGCTDGSYIQFDDTSDSESDNEPIDLISNDGDSIEAVEIFDEIEIDDSKSFQFELNAEGNQNR